ncbi:MAG: DUF2892 domain-containing protein [Acidobacteriota bacterium]|nr:MAG: DUF2892 domain-containing protein [Acidobacteriota bacterium]
MTRNVGTIDRVIRILLGIALLAMVALVDASWRWVGLIGIVPLLTALVGNCPLYSLIGVSTCPVRNHS